MTVLLDVMVSPVANLLLGCLAEEVSRVASPPRSVCMRTGDQVALLLAAGRDECCEGLAWVRVAAVFPSTNFPQPDTAYAKCGPAAWAAVLEMGVARCAPMGDATSLPACAEWEAISDAVMDDAAAMRRALCCLADIDRARMVVPGQWTPLPVEGGCVGGTTPVTVAVPACDC